jgi:hypothetical protein
MVSFDIHPYASWSFLALLLDVRLRAVGLPPDGMEIKYLAAITFARKIFGRDKSLTDC